MTDPNLADDDALEAALSEVFDELDPVPPLATALALAGFALRRVDEELAELAADSTMASSVVFRREATAARLLRFTAPGLHVEFEVDDETGRAIGVLSPPSAIRIEVETVSAAADVLRSSHESDELGRFQVPVPRGLNRLRCYPGDEVVVTPWFTR